MLLDLEMKAPSNRATSYIRILGSVTVKQTLKCGFFT